MDSSHFVNDSPLKLETAVVPKERGIAKREKGVQVIGVHREFWKVELTLLVSRVFMGFLGASRACADFRDSITDSRMQG